MDLIHGQPQHPIIIALTKEEPIVFGHIIRSDPNFASMGGEITIRPFYVNIDDEKRGVRNTHAPPFIHGRETIIKISNPVTRLKPINGVGSYTPSSSMWLYIEEDNAIIHGMINFIQSQEFQQLRAECDTKDGQIRRLTTKLREIANTPEIQALRQAKHVGDMKAAQAGNQKAVRATTTLGSQPVEAQIHEED